jgi:acyl-CoA synthetase (AMP-forming)/AMP-acid ligase II
MSKRHCTASYGTIPTEIDAGRYASINQLADEAMQHFAAKPAFRAFGQTMTYADVERTSTAFAAYLQNVAGVKKGDRVAVMLPNIFAFPIALIAIAKIGAIQVNVNPLYTARELEHQLVDAGATVMVIYDGSTPTLAEVIGKTGVKTVVTAGLGDGCGAPIPSQAVDARLTGTLTLPAAIDKGTTLAVTPVEVSGEDLLFLQYTGGTTGMSKGAALSHRNLVANIEQYKAFMPDARRPGQEVVVTAIPLYHIFALMVKSLSYFSVGADNWLVANPRDIASFIDTLKAARPTVFTGVNTLFAGLASAGRGRVLGQHRPADAFDRHQAARREGPRGRHRRSGRHLREGPAGDARLLAAARSERQGVHRRRLLPHRRRRRVRQQGVPAHRRDRKKDMILVSGFNVYPNEVEAVATACPGVAECACVGGPDEKTGEMVKLYVVKAPGASVTEADIVAQCRDGLTAYKVPKEVHFVDALQKSTVGKILRRELRDKA